MHCGPKPSPRRCPRPSATKQIFCSLPATYGASTRDCVSSWEKFYKQVETGTPVTVTPPTEEDVQSALKSLRSISESIEDMYNTGKAVGLTNRRFVGAALNSVRMRSDELEDIGESIELSLVPETDAIFDKALAALRAGDVVDFAQLK